jgi:hypothetical protein
MIGRRFSPQEELLPYALAALLASGLVGIVTVGVGGIFEGAIEMFRVGNDHLGYRGLRLQWVQHRPELLAAAIVLFWVIAAATQSFWLTTPHPQSVIHPEHHSVAEYPVSSEPRVRKAGPKGLRSEHSERPSF